MYKQSNDHFPENELKRFIHFKKYVKQVFSRTFIGINLATFISKAQSSSLHTFNYSIISDFIITSEQLHIIVTKYTKKIVINGNENILKVKQ